LRCFEGEVFTHFLKISSTKFHLIECRSFQCISMKADIIPIIER